MKTCFALELPLGESAPVTLGCALLEETRLTALRQWLAPHRGVEAEALAPPDDPAAFAAGLGRCQVLVLERPARTLARAIAEQLGRRPQAPDVILIDAAHPIAEDLHDAGLAVAFRLEAGCGVATIGQAVIDTLAIHHSLRQTCERAVGKLPLRDALALVRLYMLRTACDRTSSKRGAARELGLTRPAVQQMLLRMRLPA
jgi:hypothetical protein